MADDRYRKDYSQHYRPEDTTSRQQSHYPPPPDTAQLLPDSSNMATSVTLPSIHDSRGYAQPPPSAPGRNYPPDPRYSSPNAVNGYPPPGQQQQPPHHHQQQQQQQPPPFLPPLQPHSDPRSSAYPPPDQRGYYDDRRPQYPPEQYPQDPYYAYYRGQPPPPGPPPNGHQNYRAHLASGVYEYPPVGPGNAPQLTQAAPRQRTSIACRYCRKRKIRCSGYQSAPGGKCQNCARMNQECIFQPVSSSSSTAFIPVSAVPGGVPPGTQLFGAYGQPLAPGSIPPPPPPQGPYQHGGAPQPHPHYYAPVQSPTESYSSYGDARTDDGSQVAGRRRRRTSEEQDDGYRLPPPRSTMEEDPRRRSPAEFSNNSSPGGLGYPYPGARQSPRNPHGGGLAQPTASGSYAASAPGGHSPTGQNGSSGASTPARQGQQSQQGNSSVMSLSNLVEKNDMDKSMIDRLNRPPAAPGSAGRGEAGR